MENSNLFTSVAKIFAINFAEWLSTNLWIKNLTGLYYSPIHFQYKNVDELYDMFLKEEKNKLNINVIKDNDF
jgi:hypothetical protein